MTNALIYLRVSTPEQLKQFGIPAQLKFCRDYAADHGLTIADEPIVDDESGASLVRERWPEVERRLLAGEVKHLIIFALDRLTREPADFFPLRKRLHGRGVTIHIARQGRTINEDPLEQLPDDIEVILAKRERAVFRHRSMAGRAAKIASGRIPGNGPAPYGFSFVGHKRDRQLVINEEEAAVVRRIARWYTVGEGSGPLTIREIVTRLHELQIPTRADTLAAAEGGEAAAKQRKRRRGYAEWDMASVGYILRNAATGGTFYVNRFSKVDGKTRRRPREEWTALPAPAILEPDVFAAVQRRLDQGRALATRNNTRHVYLLRCRTTCSCGRACCGWTHTATKRQYYTCVTRDRVRYDERCGLPYVPARAAEEQAWAWLQHEALHEETLLAHLERRRVLSTVTDPRHEERDRLNAALRANETAQQRLLDLYLRGAASFDPAMLEQRQAGLRAEEAEIRKQFAALEVPPVVDAVSDAAIHDLRLYARIIREGLSDMTPAEQRRAFDMVDARFVFGVEQGEIVARASCVLRLESARLLIASQTRWSPRS